MILKELDPFASGDPLLKAGRAAEEQMAFYLRRGFKDEEKFVVLNGLRLEWQDEVAQIDHLVLHLFGFIIVESKSVTGVVEINQHGEWIRRAGGPVRGMPSPILQARRQAELLRKLLYPHSEELLPRFALGLLQMRINRYTPFDVLVAISDGGVIERPPRVAVPEVCKADVVPERIRAIHERYRKVSGPLSLDFKTIPAAFGKEEISRIGAFLVERHQPTRPGAPAAAAREESLPRAVPTERETAAEGTQPAPLPAAAGAERPVAGAPPGSKFGCQHCKSTELRVEYGPYGYYFKCLKCSRNTAIRPACEVCGSRMRIQKSGARFQAMCEKCETSVLLYVNP